MSIWTAVGGQIAGGLIGTGISQWNRKKDQERQDNQLQRMVADAKLAGISPLAALGGNTSGYAAPVGSTNTGSAIGDGVAAIGNHSASKQMRAAQAENAGLQNDLLRAQIAAINSDTVREATGRTRIPTAPQEAQAKALDHYSVRPEDMRATTGPYRGRYIFKIGGKTYVSSDQNTPKEALEAVIGEIPSEISALHGTSGLREITRPRSRPLRSKPDRPKKSGRNRARNQ